MRFKLSIYIYVCAHTKKAHKTYLKVFMNFQSFLLFYEATFFLNFVFLCGRPQNSFLKRWASQSPLKN